MNGIQYRLRKLRRHLRRDNPGEHIYIFNHIPKVGGTAVRHELEQWADIVPDYRHSSDEQETKRFIGQPLELDKIRRPAFVCGHYGLPGSRLHERYPYVFRNPRYRLITFLRDPLETAVSTYYYVRKLGHKTFSSDFQKFLMHYRTNYAESLNCTEGNVRQALSDYWFVGLTEELAASLQKLSKMLNQPYREPPILNRTERAESPTKAAIEAFRRNNRLDSEIYLAARERFRMRGDADSGRDDHHC